MPRKSKRAEILRAAYAIVAGPGGIEAVTYDRLAAETDLSKSGLLYHFPSRHELLVGLHEYTAGLWEDKVRARAGGDAADLAPRTGHARRHADNYLVSRAVGLLAARERYAFDPTDGSPLTWGESGIVARGASGTPIFPRIDPCVIGVVEHAAGDRILLGENRRRPGFFTCIAGYMDVGESAEDAFAREVLEETGRRVTDIAYVGSQPWALSGSLMLGFRARTADETQVGDTDGELSQIIWATREDLGRLTLAPEGSIARQLIERWAAGEI